MKHKKIMYSECKGASMFHPTPPTNSAALQNTHVSGIEHNNLTIQDVRNNPVFDKGLSGLDKVAAVQADLNKTASKLAENETIKNAQNPKKHNRF